MSSVSTVLYELPAHVTRPSAFQTAANVTFENSGHVIPIKMQNEDDEALLDAICSVCSVARLQSGML